VLTMRLQSFFLAVFRQLCYTSIASPVGAVPFNTSADTAWVPAWWKTIGTGPPAWSKYNPDGSDPSCVQGQIPSMSVCGSTATPVDSSGSAVDLDQINSQCVDDSTPAWPTGQWPILLHGSYWESTGCDTQNIREDFTTEEVNKQMLNWQCVFSALYPEGTVDKAVFEFPDIQDPQGVAVEAAMSWGHGAFEGMCGHSALMCNPAGQAGLNLGTNCIVNLQNGPRTWSGEFRANAYINSQNYGGTCVQPVGYMPAGSGGDFGTAVPDFFVAVGDVYRINTKYIKSDYRDQADEAQQTCSTLRLQGEQVV